MQMILSEIAPGFKFNELENYIIFDLDNSNQHHAVILLMLKQS